MDLESLRASFPACSVIRTCPPTYVQVYATTDGDILLVSTKNKSNSTTANQPMKGDNENEELDLTGSPLKLDLSLRTVLDDSLTLDESHHWAREEASHLPTTLENARTALNLYTKLTREADKDQCLPLWAVCDGADEKRTTLLTAHSYKDHFDRGVVSYEGEVSLDQISFEKMIEDHSLLEGAKKSEVLLSVEGRLRLSAGAPRWAGGARGEASRAGRTALRCEWALHTLEVPVHAARITLEQEVCVGHERGACAGLWRSVCALNSINRALVDMTAAGYAAVDLSHIDIRSGRGPTLRESTERLARLLGEAEAYTYSARGQKGGFACALDDGGSLKGCTDAMAERGSSDDFTYKLWDILKDSETAEDLMTLLLHALKALSSGKMKPFVIPSNKTYLGKLALRLSRGHSQSPAALRKLRASPPQALSLLGELAAEKTAWELTHLFTAVDNSFVVDNVLVGARRSPETMEQINQTLHDMTMGCGDTSLNPFENRSMVENSIRLDSESFYEEDTNELSIDNFASLKKHGLVSNDKKSANEVPLIQDEIDISSWKGTLSRFAQLIVCLEHLNRVQQCLMTDIASLKPIAAALQQHYVSDKSPVKTVGQLLSEPLQSFATPVPGGLVHDHINNKLASLYRVRLQSKPTDKGPRPFELVTTTHVFSQQPVFPPGIWRPTEVDANESSLQSAGIRYHSTRCVELSTAVLSVLRVENNKGL